MFSQGSLERQPKAETLSAVSLFVLHGTEEWFLELMATGMLLDFLHRNFRVGKVSFWSFFPPHPAGTELISVQCAASH